MAEKHITIYGIIASEQSEEAASAWGLSSLTTVKNQLGEVSQDDNIVVHIHSPGGDLFEGFAIHDFLRSKGAKVTTVIEGLCASIATVVALAGDERKMTANAEFMVHNPVSSIEWGDADDMEKRAAFMREIENKVIDFYASKTNADKETINEWMKEETWFSAEEAVEAGFVTEVIEELKVAAFADFTNKNKFKLKNSDLMKDEKKDSKSILARVQSRIGAIFNDEMKNALSLKNADGTEMKFDTEEEKYSVGNKVFIDGKAADDGEYVMQNEETVVVKGGLVEKILDKDGNEITENTPNEDVETVVNELVQRVEDLETREVELLGVIDKLSEGIESMYDPEKRINAPKAQKDDPNDVDKAAAAKARLEARRKKK